MCIIMPFSFFCHPGWSKTWPQPWNLSKLMNRNLLGPFTGQPRLLAQITAIPSHQSSCFTKMSIRLLSGKLIGKEFPSCRRFRKDRHEAILFGILQGFNGFHGIHNLLGSTGFSGTSSVHGSSWVGHV